MSSPQWESGRVGEHCRDFATTGGCRDISSGTWTACLRAGPLRLSIYSAMAEYFAPERSSGDETLWSHKMTPVEIVPSRRGPGDPYSPNRPYSSSIPLP